MITDCEIHLNLNPFLYKSKPEIYLYFLIFLFHILCVHVWGVIFPFSHKLILHITFMNHILNVQTDLNDNAIVKIIQSKENFKKLVSKSKNIKQYL